MLPNQHITQNDLPPALTPSHPEHRHERADPQPHQGAPPARAGDLLPRELNFHEYPELQRAALEALYREVGFARSLLAYELPDGRLKLLDDHLEVLDVSGEEARALLLSIDPLAALAETQEQLRDRLLGLAPAESEELRAAWEEAARSALEGPAPAQRPGLTDVPAQYLVLVTCRDERQ